MSAYSPGASAQSSPRSGRHSGGGYRSGRQSAAAESAHHYSESLRGDEWPSGRGGFLLGPGRTETFFWGCPIRPFVVVGSIVGTVYSLVMLGMHFIEGDGVKVRVDKMTSDKGEAIWAANVAICGMLAFLHLSLLFSAFFERWYLAVCYAACSCPLLLTSAGLFCVLAAAASKGHPDDPTQKLVAASALLGALGAGPAICLCGVLSPAACSYFRALLTLGTPRQTHRYASGRGSAKTQMGRRKSSYKTAKGSAFYTSKPPVRVGPQSRSQAAQGHGQARAQEVEAPEVEVRLSS